VPHDEALKIRDEVDFFQPVRAVLIKQALEKAKPRRSWISRFDKSCHVRLHPKAPDMQERATQTVLEQVELLGWEVAA
jgi:hypothetical protein